MSLHTVAVLYRYIWGPLQISETTHDFDIWAQTFSHENAEILLVNVLTVKPFNALISVYGGPHYTTLYYTISQKSRDIAAHGSNHFLRHKSVSHFPHWRTLFR